MKISEHHAKTTGSVSAVKMRPAAAGFVQFVSQHLRDSVANLPPRTNICGFLRFSPAGAEQSPNRGIEETRTLKIAPVRNPMLTNGPFTTIFCACPSSLALRRDVPDASVAQLAEQLTLNQLVLGSSPSRGTTLSSEFLQKTLLAVQRLVSPRRTKCGHRGTEASNRRSACDIPSCDARRTVPPSRLCAASLTVCPGSACRRSRRQLRPLPTRWCNRSASVGGRP